MKISCPKCKNAWDESEKIQIGVGIRHEWEGRFYKPGFQMDYVWFKLKGFPFCPVCFFHNQEFITLEESKIAATAIVIRNEFDEYIDVPVADLPKDMQKILQSRDCFEESDFGKEQDEGDIDDHNSTWGGAGPDCPIEQGEPA